MARIVWLLPSSEQSAGQLVQAVLDKVREVGWKHLAVRINSSKHGLIHALEAAGFRTVDIQATLVHSLAETVASSPVRRSVEVRALSDRDFGSVKHIAQGAFRQSRLYADSALDKDAADRLHVKWLANNLRGRADINLGGFDRGKAVGFVSCTLAHQENFETASPRAHIDLIAVDESFRGKGIGKTLIRAALDYYRGRCPMISVGTQGTNYPAFQLYQGCGFKLVSFQTTLLLSL
jgi:ribosomal protein S18 acetylase RimI-like enzyme